MKLKLCLLISACLVSVSSSLVAQVIVLTGQVAPGSSGIYSGPFAVGDPVRVTLDLSSQTGDLLHGSDPLEQDYGIKVGLTIHGVDIPLAAGNPNATMAVFSSYWYPGFGIQTRALWMEGGENIFFHQDMLSDWPILTPAKTFPEGIPISDFWSTLGFLSAAHVTDRSMVSDGAISWNITSYEGGDSSFPPVPEPATYGLVASGGLAFLAFFRRRFQSPKPGPTI